MRDPLLSPSVAPWTTAPVGPVQDQDEVEAESKLQPGQVRDQTLISRFLSRQRTSDQRPVTPLYPGSRSYRCQRPFGSPSFLPCGKDPPPPGLSVGARRRRPPSVRARDGSRPPPFFSGPPLGPLLKPGQTKRLVGLRSGSDPEVTPGCTVIDS